MQILSEPGKNPLQWDLKNIIVISLLTSLMVNYIIIVSAVQQEISSQEVH